MNDVITPCSLSKKMLSELLRSTRWLVEGEEIYEWKFYKDRLIVHIKKVPQQVGSEDIISSTDLKTMRKDWEREVYEQCKHEDLVEFEGS